MSELRSRTAGSSPSSDPRQDDAERAVRVAIAELAKTIDRYMDLTRRSVPNWHIQEINEMRAKVRSIELAMRDEAMTGPGSSPSTDPRQDDAEQIIRDLLPYVQHAQVSRVSIDGVPVVYLKDCDAIYGADGNCECGAGFAVKRARAFIARQVSR